MTHDTRLVAAAMVFKLLKYSRDLDSKPNKSPADNRKLLKLKTSALVMGDRVKADRAKRLGGRY